MKYSYIILYSFLFISITKTQAQTFIGNYEKIISENENTVKLATENASVILEFCTPSIIRFRTSWNESFTPNESLMVNRYDWPKVAYQKKDTKNPLILSAEKLNIQIQKQPFSVSICDTLGNLLSSDALDDKNKGNFTSTIIVSK